MRSGFLALLCVWIVSCAALHAGEAAFRLEGERLVLPDYWSYRYDPPEVLIRVKVMPDSSLSLVDILDGKQELIPYLADHLSVHKYPLADSLGISQEFDALLGIEQVIEPGPETAPAAEILPKIKAWITQAREEYNFRKPTRDPGTVSGLNFTPEPYRAGFFSYRRFSESTPLYINGFQPHNSIHSQALHENYCQGLLPWQETAWGMACTEWDYPHEVTLSDIEVGIGDFEHLTGRGALRKNRLFGVEDLYLSLDFLVQSGYWLEQDSGRNAFKLYLSAPLGKTTLQLGFADLNSQLSMHTLKPEYWRTQNFTVERRYRTLYAAWRSPWINVALFNENDTSRADEFYQTLRNDALHLKAWETFNYRDYGVTAFYEHSFANRNFTLYPEDHEQLAGLELRSASPLLAGELKAELYDLERLSLSGDVFHAWEKFDLGGVFRFRDHPSEFHLSVPNIYGETDSLRRVELREKRNLGGYLRYRPNADSRILLNAGSRNIFQQGWNAENITAGSREVTYLRLGAELRQTWKQWQLDWFPSFTWQNIDLLFEEAEFQYQSHLGLTRLLSHDNALFAGFSLTGHSGYLSSDPTYFEVQTSAIADVWAGVRITERFELTVTYKNLADSAIYGVYPLPPSLHASLRWFFLN